MFGVKPPKNVPLCQFIPSMLYSHPRTAFSVMLSDVYSLIVGDNDASPEALSVVTVSAGLAFPAAYSSVSATL